jgi:predicted acetyltransferase
MNPVPKDVYLLRATPESAPLLCNLLELYIHDMSPFFPVELGPDGRFGYKKLPLYWSEPELRQAFFIRYGSRLAGFALATRGSPASDNPEDLDVAEFFILRSYRRLGIGCQAAAALWDALPGRWVVRVSKANQSGLSFWIKAISQYTAGNFVDREGKALLHGWRVLTFASKAAGNARQ